MDVFQALSDPARRLIIDLLAAGERSVGDINAVVRPQLNMTPSAVSQHLSVLRKAGLVLVRGERQKRLYRLDPTRYTDMQPWLSKPQAPRKQPTTPVTLVNATGLETWANRHDAQAAFPRLLRRLILATGTGITRIEFRAGEGVQFPGWDGLVVAETANAFVPKGTSIWELGTNKDIKRKADQDYAKRSQDPLGVDPSQSAYVCVTPRRWAGKMAWAQERMRDGIWGSVRVYDADDLETWLEVAPAVHIWLSIVVGTHPEGASDLENVWKDWSESTSPPLSTNFVLAGRGEIIEKIKAWLKDSAANTLALQAESKDEALGVFAATALSLPDEERLPLLSRMIVVDSMPAWNRLALFNEPLILIPRFEDSQAIGRATRNGHRVMVPLSADDTISTAPAERIPVLARTAAESALREMMRAAGIPEERITDEQVSARVTLARRSMACFCRQIALRPEVQQPLWAEPENGRLLLPAVLAGAWNDRSDGDREVIERLSRRTYEEFSDSLVRWCSQPDSPVKRIGDVWLLVSREDAWLQLARYLTRDDAQRFEKVVLDVLGNHDPRFDLPPGERWASSVHGKTRPQSETLCRGLAETLAVMGARSKDTHAPMASTCEEVAGNIVGQLFQRANADWRVWASLSGMLPLLAEAAPDVFLGAVESGLARNSPVLELFKEEPSPLFGTSHHTGLLSALETLAWSPQYLSHAVLILAKLARLDPGGKLANRPQASLRGIFLPWMPQTAANVGRRLDVIDTLRKHEPDTAWALMRKLLPEHHSVGHPTHKSRWRDWSLDNQSVINRDYFAFVKGVFDRMLEDVGTTGRRWKHLIEALAVLPREQYDIVVGKLSAVDFSQIPISDRQVIRDALRSFISRHRSYAEAEWALPEERLVPLDALYERLTPEDPSARYSWLFGDRPDIPEGREQDWRAHEKTIAQARAEAVQEIYSHGGIQSLLSLLPQVQRPSSLGFAMGKSELFENEEDSLLREHLASAVPAAAEFARGFVCGRVASRSRDWAKSKVMNAGTRLSAEQRGTVLACLVADGATWDLVDRTDKETQAEYWRLMQQFGLDDGDRERCVRKLLEYGRPYSAIDVLTLTTRKEIGVADELIVQALDLALNIDPDADHHHLNTFSHNVAQLLNALESSSVIDGSQVAMLEWKYLPYVRLDRAPKFLHRELAQNPKFFVDLLEKVYRANGEEPREVTKQEQAVAFNGHELLDSWRTLPGTDDNGQINAEKFMEWIRAARTEGEARNRGEIGDHVIGGMLSGSPDGADGAWPAEPVRDIIESIASKDIETGIEVGRYNSRGVHWRNPSTGGAAEREIAKRYEKDAAAIGDRWPGTAAMLRRIAVTYRLQARREDDQSELMGRLDAQEEEES